MLKVSLKQDFYIQTCNNCIKVLVQEHLHVWKELHYCLFSIGQWMSTVLQQGDRLQMSQNNKNLDCAKFNLILSIYFSTRRQSKPTNLPRLQHVRLNLSVKDFHVKISIIFLLFFFVFYFAQRLNPSHVTVAEQHPSKKKKGGVGKKLPMPLFYPFSSTHLFPPPFIQEGLFP